MRRHVRKWIAAQLAGSADTWMLLLHLLVRVARHAVRSTRSASHVRWRSDAGRAGQVVSLLQFEEGVFRGDGRRRGGRCRCRGLRLLVAVSSTVAVTTSDDRIGCRRRHVVIAAVKVAVDETIGRTGRRWRRRRTPPYLMRRRRLQRDGQGRCV